MNSKVAFDYFAAFAGFIALSVLVALALSVSGCSIAPRNQTYCSQNMKWVKCPIRDRMMLSSPLKMRLKK